MIRNPASVAEVLVPHTIAEKIKTKHNVTVAEVREAVVLCPVLSAVAGQHHGSERLFIEGITYVGRTLKVSLCPVDEELGVWRLATAMPSTGRA